MGKAFEFWKTAEKTGQVVYLSLCWLHGAAIAWGSTDTAIRTAGIQLVLLFLRAVADLLPAFFCKLSGRDTHTGGKVIGEKNK